LARNLKFESISLQRGLKSRVSRGTDGSNPSPSSGESANYRFPEHEELLTQQLHLLRQIAQSVRDCATTPTSVLLPYLACEGCRSTAITTQTEAALSTLSVLPHRVGLRQLSSTPKLMMPPVIGKPLCSSSRIVTALVCYPFTARGLDLLLDCQLWAAPGLLRDALTAPK
jgi:hypothetical protein